jgi:hypothetical protein
MFTPLSEIPTGDSRILWVTLANSGYGEYVKNFTQSMERAHVGFRLVVFCIDPELAVMLGENPHVICVDARPFLPTSLSSELSTWGKSNYIRITFGKIDVMRIACELGAPYVGYIDTDLVLLHDPSLTALGAFDADSAVQVVAQCGEGRYCTVPKLCPELCSGVIVFRNSEGLRAHLQYTNDDVEANPSGDQVYLTAVFKREGVCTRTIHKDVWVHGGPYGPIYDSTVPLPAGAELYHFNFLAGDSKKEAMKRMNMWYI